MANIDLIIDKIKKLFDNFAFSNLQFGSSSTLAGSIWQKTSLAKNYMISDLGGE